MPLTRPTVASAPLTSGALEAVTPPAPTSEAVASGGSVTSWTFSAFTDPDSRIASYSATLTAVVGSGSLSGSGLGPYSLTGTADGDSYTVELDALDSDGAVLATATHSVAIAAPSSLVYEVKYDGVDAYGEIAPLGSLPAALQFDPTVESWTMMIVVRCTKEITWRAGVFGSNTGMNWMLRQATNGRLEAYLQNSGTSAYAFRNNTAYATSQGGQYQCYGWEWNHATTTLSVRAGGPFSATATDVEPGVSTIDYSTCGAFIGPAVHSALTSSLGGGVAQFAIWTGTHLADINTLWNDGVPFDWSTHTTPPDVLHYRIGSDDDATTTDGIQDRTGNGLHMTMFNAVAGDIALRGQPRY